MVYFIGRHWCPTYWIALLICSRFPVQSVLWEEQFSENYKPTHVQLRSLINTPISNNLIPFHQNVGQKSGEMDNPNKIQKLMAQEFIRSVSNLFNAYDENSGDNKVLPESYVKPMHDIKARMKQLAAIGLIPRTSIVSEEGMIVESRKKRSYNVVNNYDGLYKIYKCRRVGPLTLECSKDSGMLDPYRRSYKKSHQFPIRNLSKRQCLSEIDVFHYNNISSRNKIPAKSNDIHEIGSEPSRSLSHFIPDKNQEPPVELTMSQDESSRPRSKWTKRQAYCGRQVPGRGRYDLLTPDSDVRIQELSCRRCTRRASPMPTRLSANIGKTARIRFPASHRCIRHTCPCRVTKLVIPQRTTCLTEPLLPEKVSTGRCSGLDLVGGVVSTSPCYRTIGSQMENNTEEEEEVDSYDDERTVKRFSSHGLHSRQSYSQEPSRIRLLKSRSCDCRCGCGCQRGGSHPEQNAAVGRSSCGCSCGCGCNHLPDSPDCAPHQLRAKERCPVSRTQR